VTPKIRLNYTTVGLKDVPWLVDCTTFPPAVQHLEVVALPGNKKVRAARDPLHSAADRTKPAWGGRGRSSSRGAS
jgi:hypothetical protein